MKLCKRIVAGISALAMLVSVPLNSGLIAIAEETVPAVTETQTNVDNTENDEPTESTTTTTTTEPQEGTLETTTTQNSDSDETTTATTNDNDVDTSGNSTEITTTTTSTETTTTETTTETTTTTTKDTSPPKLYVTPTDQANWLNEETIKSWNVSADDGAIVYYKTYEITTETEVFVPNADYKSEGAVEWNSVEDLPEGSHYIVFWAAYPDEECEIADPEVYQYHLDKSKPESFELITDTEEEGWRKYFVISDRNGISDSISGIKKVSYQINNWGVNDFDNDDVIDYDASGNIVGFSLKIDSWVENATITVYVEDMAGNVREQKIENITHDSSIPQITEIAITNKAEQGATILECLTFGKEELQNLIKHIFANDKYFLAVTVSDNNLKEISVNVNGTPIPITADKWICNDDSNSAEKTYYIEFSLLSDALVENEANTIKVTASDDQNSSEEIILTIDDVECTVLYDPKNDDDCTITFTPNITPVDDGFFGEISDDNAIEINMSDDVGIAEYEVRVNGSRVTSVVCEETDTATTTATVVVTDDSGVAVTDADGETQTETVTDTVEYDVITKSAEYSLKLNNYKENKNYVVEVTLIDLAGNSNVKTYDFTVDSTPPVIDNFTYTVNPSMLKFFTFGIFGNETISIDINVRDNDSGIGVDSEKVFLYWAPTTDGELHEYSAKLVDEASGVYRFENLPIGNEAVPYIVVYDKMGNSNTFYFATKDTAESSSVGELMLEDEDTTDGVTLVLEEDKPTVSVTVPSTYTKYTVAGETWYGEEIKYVVSAKDTTSGLNCVEVQENDGNPKKETSFEGINFNSNRFQDDATYTYELVDANDYTITANAHDNAGNSSDPDELKVHIDKENPVISKFVFGIQEDYGSEIAKTTYGYYFKEETAVKIYVNDPGVTSGINGVTLYLSNIDGTNNDRTVVSTDTDLSDGMAYLTDETGSYAVFTIPMGFKGTVVAEVIDNVEHTSGLVNADGSIIEDDAIHNRTSSIEITETVETDKVDAANVPLYNRSIPLTITVKDTFSGISTIEWSIANDGESGVITVANDGKYESNSPAAIIGAIETESNLVTSMQFTLSVDDNSNGNVVLIKLTDRSGNSSEVSETYSIDTTAPDIQASFGNTSVQNGSYYKDTQTVNITITERNFNGSEVVVTLNGQTQNVSWDNAGDTVGQDSTTHRASFSIAADGDYVYEVSYTDRAGNAGTPITSSQFTVDTTDPSADITFDIGDDTVNNAYYNSNRTATFTVVEHNYSNAVISITKDGADVSSNYDLDNWSPANHSGDNHSQSVVINESGYYKVSIAVTDLAGNTFQTESNNFYIDLAAPKATITVDNVANGSPSNAASITPIVSIEDIEGNLDTNSLTLKITTVKLNEKLEIVSDTVTLTGLDEWRNSSIGTVKVDDENAPNEITFDFNNLNDDGIYTFEVTATDLAGNVGGESDEDKTAGAKYKISVNRLGSTYEIDSKITDVETDMRYYRNKEDTLFTFTISEYNVNTLNPEETIVKITCDGTVIENNIVAVEETGSDKWSKYTYEFPSELMTTSGKYIVKLYSVDAAGNENPLAVEGQDERATVTFFIDNDDPTVYFRDADDKTEFTNEEPYRTDKKRVEVEVYDNSQKEAQNVVFTLNGETINAEHETGTMIYTLEIPSKSSAQDLVISLDDIAGNHLEGGVEDFLITTNVFILWFENTPLFIGSIVAFLAAVGGTILVIARKKRKSSL